MPEDRVDEAAGEQGQNHGEDVQGAELPPREQNPDRHGYGGLKNHGPGYVAEGQGILIADTKFEFGLLDGQLVLIDEVLTPDSSRFWPKDQYRPGRPQKSFDKQFLRDYLLTLDWDQSPPAPDLPQHIIEKTREKYLEAYRRLLGKPLF